MASRIYGESDGSWAIYIDDQLRGEYKSSLEMAEHLASLIEKQDAVLEVMSEVRTRFKRLCGTLVDLDLSR